MFLPSGLRRLSAIEETSIDLSACWLENLSASDEMDDIGKALDRTITPVVVEDSFDAPLAHVTQDGLNELFEQTRAAFLVLADINHGDIHPLVSQFWPVVVIKSRLDPGDLIELRGDQHHEDNLTTLNTDDFFVVSSHHRFEEILSVIVLPTGVEARVLLERSLVVSPDPAHFTRI